MTNYSQRRPTRVGRPLGPWDRIAPGLRAAIICAPVLLGLFLINEIGAVIFSASGFVSGLICYPVQLLIYAFTGWVAGAQARSSYNKSTRVVGRSNEVVRRQKPNYSAQGALAGVLVGILAIIVYFAAGAAAASLIPGAGLFLSYASASLVLFLIVDFFLCVGLGTIGGVIYSRLD